MKLDLSKPFDKNKFVTYSAKLLEGGKQIELKEVRKSRTLKQNSYLHVIITLYAIYFGSTLEEAKTDGYVITLVLTAVTFQRQQNT